MRYYAFGRPVCFIAMFTLLCICGCGSTEKPFVVRSNLDIPTLGNQAKIPMRAALYVEPAFAKWYCWSKMTVGKGRLVFLGDSLRNNCENMMKNLFQDVVILSPSDISMNNVDVIVTPRVKTLDYTNKVKVVNDFVCIQMTIEWNIVSPSGKQIYLSPIKSEASGIVSGRMFASTLDFCYKEEELGEVYAHLIEDQCRKAQQELYSAQWWKDPWWKTPSVETGIGNQ